MLSFYFLMELIFRKEKKAAILLSENDGFYIQEYYRLSPKNTLIP